jgi:aspartyl aminopeptidase
MCYMFKLLTACYIDSQGEEGSIERTLRQSFLISADMAHALHPNYTDKHDTRFETHISKTPLCQHAG